MKKMIFINILTIMLIQFGYAQNRAVTKLILKGDGGTSLIKVKIAPSSYYLAPKIIYATEKASEHLLFFNDHPVLKLREHIKLPLLLLTELSFNDVLENSLNVLKSGLINTYDDEVSELFKDAPSMFKLKFILSF